MISQRVWAVTLFYILSRQVSTWFNPNLGPSVFNSVFNTDGEASGPLIHRRIQVEKTLSGKKTRVVFHYVESLAPGKECIVFLHGFMDTWKLWQKQLEFLSDRYHVVAFDLKGCGQSSMNYPQTLFPDLQDPGGNYQLHMQADELVSALTAIGVQRFNLVTLDLGTIIADVLAGQYPDRVIRYIRCQQPLVGHFKSSIPQGYLLKRRRSARLFTTLLETDPSTLIRILYGRTGWKLIDEQMKRTKTPILDDASVNSAIQEAAYPFQWGPRAGRPGTFVCAWAGLYQHNPDYWQFLHNNLQAYQRYTFPVFLVQGIHDIAMPPSRFDGSTGMALKIVATGGSSKQVLSRPFDANGNGLGDGYLPWGDLIPGASHPLPVQAFFPHSQHVELKFMDTGHFIPKEDPEAFNVVLDDCLSLPVLERL